MSSISSTFAGLNGCWYALPLATAAKPSAAARQEMDVSGKAPGSG